METILNESNFEQEIKQDDIPVVVDFWAEWCAPCKMFGPIIQEIAETYQDRLKVGKVNVDENPGLSARFGIMGIPTTIIFVGGQEKERLQGAASKEQLVQLVEKYLNKD